MARKTRIRSIFFHPRRPIAVHKIEYLRKHMGWNLADSPETADWCVLHEDTTWLTLPDGDSWAEVSAAWINGRCRDISKRTVERVFEAAFGYPLAVDPLTHQGLCLRKSDKNYVKDAVVLACPISADEFDDRYVYQRLVDSTVPGLGTSELRAAVVGGDVVAVRRWIRPDWLSTTGRLNSNKLDEVIVVPSSVFSPPELEQISVFCDAMGLDLGELDVIRDREDGRIYVLDVSNTPSYDLGKIWAVQELEEVARAVNEHFPPRSTKPKSTKPAKKLDRTAAAHGMSDRQSREDGIATIVETQTERFARLEADVGELRADIARVLSALGVERQRPRKKKRTS